MTISKEFKNRFCELLATLDVKKLSEYPKLIGVGARICSDARIYGIYPSVRKSMKIADFFNVSVDYLLALTDNNNYVKSANPTTYGERLRQLQSIKPARALLFHTNITKSSYDSWISGESFPQKWKHVLAIAEFYRVSVDYLLGRTDEMN